MINNKVANGTKVIVKTEVKRRTMKRLGNTKVVKKIIQDS